jgi:hypothetical protein
MWRLVSYENQSAGSLDSTIQRLCDAMTLRQNDGFFELDQLDKHEQPDKHAFEATTLRPCQRLLEQVVDISPVANIVDLNDVGAVGNFICNPKPLSSE